MFEKPPLPDLKKVIYRCSSEKPDRDICRDSLEIVLPQVRTYQSFCDAPGEQSDEKFDSDFRELQSVILKDFYSKKLTDWLSVLQKHDCSPLMKHQIDAYTKESKPTFFSISNDIKQAFSRSNERKMLHLQTFKQSAITAENLIFPKDISQTVLHVLQTLIEKRAIISNEINHWTTEWNLKSIIRNQIVCGNQVSQDSGLFFQTNTLNTGDIKNGDGGVMCFCPGLVDDVALMRRETIRAHLVRFSINLQKVVCHGKYNQFFKLFDFFAPSFSRGVKINSDLTVHICKQAREKSVMDITISLFDTTTTITINKSNAIFYGDLDSINGFCLKTVFDLFNAHSHLKDYLESLSENEIAKVFILIGQAITLFSEYNFNHSLKLTPFLIKEIYYVESNMLWKLNQDSHEHYEKQLQSVLNNQIGSDAYQLSPPLITSIRPRELSVNGYNYHTPFSRPEDDYSLLSIDYLGAAEYIETRYGAKPMEEYVDSQLAASNMAACS